MARTHAPELMDDPGLDPAEHRRALAGLARINRLTDSAGLLWRALLKLPLPRRGDPGGGEAEETDRGSRSPLTLTLSPEAGERGLVSGRPLRVLDVATGSGDVPARLAHFAAKAGVPVEIHACDISETAVAEAKSRSPNIHFFRHDALADPLPTGFDAVTCSLFLHHLSNADAVKLLAAMARAGRTVLVNDLSRGKLNYTMVWIACRLLSRSPVVHYDGPVSVRAAFTRAEVLSLAEKAGLHGATVTSKFPCRWLLEWRAPP